MAFFGDLVVRRVDAALWRLTNDLIYEGRWQTFRVPAGYVTDFASVPRFMRWLVNTYGAYTLAAILHDWLITHGIPAGLVSSRDADGIFRRVMKEEGVDPVTRWLMWAAVRWGAVFNPARAAGRGFWRDAPVLLPLSVVALLLVSAGGVGVLISLALVRVASWLVAPFSWWAKRRAAVM